MKKDKIDQALEESLLNSIEALEKLPDGSAEKKAATEEIKNLVEAKESRESNRIDNRDKLRNFGVNALKVVGGIAVGLVTTFLCLDFEETGAVTSFTGRNILGKNQNPKF